MKRIIAAIGIFLGSWLLPTRVEAASLNFSQLIVLGDSLSDIGNVFAASGNNFPPEDLGYFNGRFTNGENWIDNLARDLGLGTPTPIVDIFNGAVPQGGVNLAFGGATTEAVNTSDSMFPALQDVSEVQPGQISLLTNLTNLIDPNALYIFWYGANDYLPTTSPNFAPFDTPETTVNNIANGLTNLAGLGAKNILIPNLPLLGSVPRANNLDPFFPMVELGTAERLDLLSVAHNQLLSTTIEDLSANFGAEVNLIPLEIDRLFERVITEFNTTPDRSPFSNITDVCLLNPACTNPDEFFYWDGIHPTKKTHEIIGQFALETLEREAQESIPEPSSTWVLVILGGLFIGARVKIKCA